MNRLLIIIFIVIVLLASMLVPPVRQKLDVAFDSAQDSDIQVVDYKEEPYNFTVVDPQTPEAQDILGGGFSSINLDAPILYEAPSGQVMCTYILGPGLGLYGQRDTYISE